MLQQGRKVCDLHGPQKADGQTFRRMRGCVPSYAPRMRTKERLYLAASSEVGLSSLGEPDCLCGASSSSDPLWQVQLHTRPYSNRNTGNAHDEPLLFEGTRRTFSKDLGIARWHTFCSCPGGIRAESIGPIGANVLSLALESLHCHT